MSKDQMSPYVSLQKGDLLEAWEKGCPDVRNTLEFLYPDDLPPKAKEKNVTREIEFEYLHDEFFIIKHNGKEVSRQERKGVVDDYGCLTTKFGTPKMGYRFEKQGIDNWKLIKIG